MDLLLEKLAVERSFPLPAKSLAHPDLLAVLAVYPA
jgi:hypothetical protein